MSDALNLLFIKPGLILSNHYSSGEDWFEPMFQL